MKWIGHGIEIILLAVLSVCFLVLPQTAATGIASGLDICGKTILPSLFPFLVLTNYWIKRGYADKISQYAAPVVQKVFRLPGAVSSAILLGSVGGYPVGAATIAQLYHEDIINQDQAEHAMLFCNNAGPAFVIGVMGSGLFQSTTVGIWLYLIHLLSAVLIGILFRRKAFSEEVEKSRRFDKLAVSSAVTESIRIAGSTAIQVCISIIFFSVVTSLLRYIAEDAIQATWGFSVLIGLVELAGGTNALRTAVCSSELRFITASLFLGWGGLCVMLQASSILQAEGLCVRKLLIGKLLHGVISALFTALLLPLLPAAVSCGGFSGAYWKPQAAIILILLLFALFLKESTGKEEEHHIYY